MYVVLRSLKQNRLRRNAIFKNLDQEVWFLPKIYCNWVHSLTTRSSHPPVNTLVASAMTNQVLHRSHLYRRRKNTSISGIA
jgi:hypothetical protein